MFVLLFLSSRLNLICHVKKHRFKQGQQLYLNVSNVLMPLIESMLLVLSVPKLLSLDALQVNNQNPTFATSAKSVSSHQHQKTFANKSQIVLLRLFSENVMLATLATTEVVRPVVYK